MKSYKSYKFSDSEYNGTTITNMIEHYWSNISNQTYGIASFLNSSNAFSGTYYKHDNNNGFIIFSGQSPSYKTQKGIMMNGNWTWTSLVTNTDLQAHWPKVLHFNIEANTYKTIKEQGSNRFSQLLFLQTANTNGYGLYLLSGYGNEGGTNRYYISEIASGSQFNIEVSETSFKVTNSNHSTATVALVSFMGDIPTIQ